MNFLTKGKKKNKYASKKSLLMITTLFVLLILFTTTGNVIIASNNTPQTELSLEFYGSGRLLFIPAVGYAVFNNGDETAENVIGIFTIEGGIMGNIDFEATYDFNNLEPEGGLIVSYPHAIDGIGFVTVSIDATCDNAEPVSKTARGFQIGMRTIIFG